MRGAVLEFEYSLEGEIEQLRWPASRQPERMDGLWQHTCFEAFLAESGRAGYCEFNFSPSGAWAAYRFAAYRAGMQALDVAQAPCIDVRREANRVRLVAAVMLSAVPELLDWARGASLELGLAAVLESSSGQRTYWSVRHAPERADFHDRQGFCARLEGNYEIRD